MAAHHLGTVGQLVAQYDTERGEIHVLFMAKDSSDVLERWDFNDTPSIDDVASVIRLCRATLRPLTTEETLFLIDQLSALEAHQEYAESDLARYGEIAVTY